MLFNIAIFSILILLVLFFLLSRESIRNKLTFYPDKVSETTLPQNANDIKLQTEDGESIQAFHFRHPEHNSLIIYFHGNAGNIYHRLDYAQILFEMGHDVLLMSYRGYANSTGKPSEKGIYLDGFAAYKYAVSQLGLGDSDIILFGRSLGSAVAVHLGQNKNFKGIILVTPISSGKEMAQSMGLGVFKHVVGNSFNSIGKIHNLKSRLLVIHGDEDEIVPYTMGEKLIKAYQGDKKFITIPGAGHNNITDVNPSLYWGEIQKFLKSTN